MRHGLLEYTLLIGMAKTPGEIRSSGGSAASLAFWSRLALSQPRYGLISISGFSVRSSESTAAAKSWRRISFDHQYVAGYLGDLLAPHRPGEHVRLTARETGEMLWAWDRRGRGPYGEMA